jgi:hypothetical protein
MVDSPKPMTEAEIAARRKSGVRRTAWLVGAVAIAVYVAFLLSGVFGK